MAKQKRKVLGSETTSEFQNRVKKTFIDCTPTWMGLYPMYSEWIMVGTEKQKRLVADEFKKLCQLADKVNADNKKSKR